MWAKNEPAADCVQQRQTDKNESADVEWMGVQMKSMKWGRERDGWDVCHGKSGGGCVDGSTGRPR